MSQSADRPDLRQLRIQAKELVRSVRAGRPEAITRAVAYFSSSSEFTLANAQLVVARENGFDSWPRLRRELETVNAEPAESTSDLLFKALESGDDGVALAMIEQSPDLAGVWRRSRYGGWESGLNVAAQMGRLAPVKALVEAGAEVYPVNQGHYPPVFNAVSSGHKEVGDYLMAASADSDNKLPPTYGCGIDIVLASRLGMLDRIQMHVAHDPFAVFRRGVIGETVLHWPAHNGYVDTLRFLLDAGAQISADEIGLYGGKPLHWAAEHAPESVALLLGRGADPNARNLMPGKFEGYTPLHMMARQPEQRLECAQLLLDAGADPRLVAAEGQTPLDVAREHGREETVAFLSRSRS